MKRLFVALAIPLICSSAEAQNQSALPRKEAYTECAEFHVTKSKFAPEIEDLSSFIQAEVGTNARQAEWSEIKSCFAKFGLKYFRRLGVRMQRIRDRPEDDESQMLVLVNGKRYFSPKTRAYFAAFHGGHLPRSFLPHDQVAGYQISLGSWFYPLRAFYVVEAKSGNAQPIAKPSPTSVDWEICRDPRHTKADLMATIAACSRLITSGDIRDRNLVTTYLWRALHLREAGELDRAISDYDSAIRLDPSRSSAYHERGSVFHTKGDYQRAIADYSEAIRLDTRNANAFNNRALAYRKLGDLDRAIRDYDASIRVEPNNPRAYGNRGVAYAARGDYDRAIADLSEAIRLDPHDPDIFKDRGAVYRENDDYER